MSRQSKPKPSAVVSGGTEPGFTLKKLRHDDFHEICGLVERARTIIPDALECGFDGHSFGFRPGYRVITPDGQCGELTGFAVDAATMRPVPFARVNGRLYHVSTLKRV